VLTNKDTAISLEEEEEKFKSEFTDYMKGILTKGGISTHITSLQPN
jgi:hypothetical protein